jgi:hypothetical protein
MWRTALLVALAYGYGHPGLDGYRPDSFDRPFEAFHAEINQVARQGYQTLVTLDDTRVVRALRLHIEQVQNQLRAKD